MLTYGSTEGDSGLSAAGNQWSIPWSYVWLKLLQQCKPDLLSINYLRSSSRHPSHLFTTQWCCRVLPVPGDAQSLRTNTSLHAEFLFFYVLLDSPTQHARTLFACSRAFKCIKSLVSPLDCNIHPLSYPLCEAGICKLNLHICLLSYTIYIML